MDKDHLQPHLQPKLVLAASISLLAAPYIVILGLVAGLCSDSWVTGAV